MQEQLQIENLTKRFGAVVANDQVKFNVLRGRFTVCSEKMVLASRH